MDPEGQVEGTGVTRDLLRFRLETDLATFENVADVLLAELAAAAGVPVENVRITRIELGCVEVFIEFREAPEAVLRLTSSEANDDPIGQLYRKYAVSHVMQVKKYSVPYVSHFLEDSEARCDRYLGHANHSVGRRYTHALSVHLSDDAAALDAYLGGAAAGRVVPLAAIG